MRPKTRNSVAISLLSLAILALSSPAVAQTVPFKVFITELWQLDAGVDPGVGQIADYYARVTINGIELSNPGACEDGSLTGIIVPMQMFKNFSAIGECGATTPWVFARDVPANQPVTVRIQIFDSDAAFDDEGDAKPGDGNSINLTIDPVTGRWSGDVAWPQTCSRPGLSLGGNNVNVCWQASFDTDDDGLLDVWERSGVDTDNDGVIDIDLPALGANPLRKDVFLEADFVEAANHTHSPNRNAIAQVVTSFANAPVTNPDGTTGFQLHVDVGPLYGAGLLVPVPGAGGAVGSYGHLGGGGGAIPESGNEIIDEFGGTGSATPFADLKAAHFDVLREYVFRYTIFGHQTNARVAVDDCTSGQASSTRRDFLVTLGGVDDDGLACWSTDSNAFSVGSISEQAGTLMHELGHTLGLRHGGNVEVNNKPNYLSVMNYSFQSCGVPFSAGLLPGGCDYSRIVAGSLLPVLDEIDLDECVGISGGLGFGAMDWNADGMVQGQSQCGLLFANATADVNNDGVCIEPGANGVLDTTPAGDDRVKDGKINDGPNRSCNTTVSAGSDDVQKTASGFAPSQPQELKSFDDWDAITGSLISFVPLSGSGSAEQEPDSKTLRESRRTMNEMTAPNVTLDASGPPTGKPGDVLTYSVTVKNTGRGPALLAVLSATSPDGTSQTSDLGVIAVGDARAQTWNFTVPGSACPGTFTSASASMAFKNFVGGDLTAADAVPLEILDVAPPAMEVAVSPASLWPPNHKLQEVTATITVTDNCDPQPVVTLVSVTSNEPEAGFIGQGDKGPDIHGAAIGTDDRTFSLRSERGTGQGSTGRQYTIVYRVTDSSGNSTVASATVTVPTSSAGQ